jgi:hypothetical protein
MATSFVQLEQTIKAMLELKSSAGTGLVRKELEKTDIYALGHPAGDTSVPGYGTESDVLHFSIDEEGKERVMLPVFTRPEIIRDALLKNPEWQTLSVLLINGKSLLDSADPEVTVVVNPWSDMEYQIPVAGAVDKKPQ